MVEVGFEPTPLARLELESSALDRSAIRPTSMFWKSSYIFFPLSNSNVLLFCDIHLFDKIIEKNLTRSDHSFYQLLTRSTKSLPASTRFPGQNKLFW